MALGANSFVSSSNTVVVGNSSVTSIGGYANWTNFSDGRYKKNIQSNVPGLTFINQLTPVTYTLDIAGIEGRLRAGKTSDETIQQAMREKSAVVYTGFVAQDVEKAADEVHFTFSGVDKPANPDQGFYGLRYSDFVPPLVKAVQELSASLDSMKAEMAALRTMVMAQKAAASGASLEQNTPNPFTGSTVIPYTLPVGAASARLQISDINGRVLAVIPLTGDGKRTVTADVEGYAAGAYTYSLFVNGKLVGTKQMISVR